MYTTHHPSEENYMLYLWILYEEDCCAIYIICSGEFWNRTLKLIKTLFIT